MPIALRHELSLRPERTTFLRHRQTEMERQELIGQFGVVVHRECAARLEQRQSRNSNTGATGQQLSCPRQPAIDRELILDTDAPVPPAVAPTGNPAQLAGRSDL